MSCRNRRIYRTARSTEIRGYAFSGDNLRTVTFAYNDAVVRGYSFYNCHSLNKIVIPEGADVEFREQSICSDT